MIVSFGGFTLDALARTLEGPAGEIELQPKAFDVLELLVREHHRVVSRDEMLAALWPQETVTPTAINVAVNAVRKALGDTGGEQRWVQTHRGRGYRFVGEVEAVEGRTDQGFHHGEAFVGRQLELAELERLFMRTAQTGQGGVVVVSGDAGIGKTRLVEEFRGRLEGRSVRTALGRGLAGEGAPAFLAWAHVLHQVLDTVADQELEEMVGVAADDLAQLAPEISERTGRSPARPASGEYARLRLFTALGDFLSKVAGRRGLVVVLDDVQWLDESSLLLLASLAEGLSRAAILIVATLRNEELEATDPRRATLDALARRGLSRALPLRGLARSDVEALLVAVGSADTSPRFVEAIESGTEGNPFFILETLRHLSDLSDRGGGESPEFTISDLARVDGVQSIVSRRLDRLGPSARETLAIASVIGREFDFEDARGIADEPGPVARHLAEALRSHLVVEDRSTAGRHAFSHAVTREVLYHELGAVRRAELHARCAALLSEVHRAASPRTGRRAPSAAEWAHHAERALQVAPTSEGARTAVEARRAAAREAMAGLAFEDAARHLATSLSLVRAHAIDDLELECQLLLEAMDAHSSAGRAADAERFAFEAASLARRIGNVAALGRAALGGPADMVQRIIGMETSIDLLREALDAIGDESTSRRALLLARLSLAHTYGDSQVDSERERLAEEAEEIARAVEDDEALYWSLVARHASEVGLAAPKQVLGRVDELEAIAERSGDGALVLRAAAYRVAALLRAGQARRAFETVERVSLLAEAVGSPLYRWTVENMRACAAQVTGAADAEALCHASLAAGQRTNQASASLVFVCQLGAVRYGEDRLEELLPALADLRDDVGLSVVGAVEILARASRGDLDEAKARLDQFAGADCEAIRADDLWLASAALIVPVIRRLGDRDRARILYDQMLPHEAGFVVVGNASACLGSVARSLGLLAATLGDDDAAVRHLEAALEAEEREGLRLWAVHTRRESARLARQLGEGKAAQAEARGRMARARDDANAMGLLRLAERIGDELDGVARDH